MGVHGRGQGEKGRVCGGGGLSGAGETAAVMQLPTSGPYCLGCDFQEQQGKVDGLLQVSGLLCRGI